MKITTSTRQVTFTLTLNAAEMALITASVGRVKMSEAEKTIQERNWPTEDENGVPVSFTGMWYTLHDGLVNGLR